VEGNARATDFAMPFACRSINKCYALDLAGILLILEGQLKMLTKAIFVELF
jgi:hypothetical protein